MAALSVTEKKQLSSRWRKEKLNQK